MQMLKQIDRTRFQMDFLVHTAERWAFDDAAQAMGARIISCLHPSRPWQYGRHFYAILSTHGPYHIVHSHVHHFSGYIARLAHHAGVPARIVHSHCGTSAVDGRAGMGRRLYIQAMRSWIHRYATCEIAASHEAALALFGSGRDEHPRWRVMHCGIDLAPFQVRVDPVAMRGELGIPQEARVIGHVGTLSPPKNHLFLLRVASEIIHRRPNVFLLLVGEGPLRPAIEEEMARLGIANHVILCGARGDVPRLMNGAMDVFFFPSLWEGLPLALIEAQAAGLPCVISDVVTREADVVHQLLVRLSLGQSSTVWSDALVHQLTTPPCVGRKDALAMVTQSAFDCDTSSRELERLYLSV